VRKTIFFVFFETVVVVLAVFVDIREVDVPVVVVILKKGVLVFFQQRNEVLLGILQNNATKTYCLVVVDVVAVFAAMVDCIVKAGQKTDSTLQIRGMSEVASRVVAGRSWESSTNRSLLTGYERLPKFKGKNKSWQQQGRGVGRDTSKGCTRATISILL
jgi:hypothetical protein